MRRVNPRGQPIKGQGVPGGSNNSHRLIRRGMPYGAYVPATPDDGIERGLLGYIINSSIENQFANSSCANGSTDVTSSAHPVSIRNQKM
jgi:deferrochelatase/peroxidase EfeB